MKALLLGSIGVVAETSDIQRRAYNHAFVEVGLPWYWSRATYERLLEQPGGQDRLRQIGERRGSQLSDADIDAIHARKTAIACAVVARGIELRPGVAALIDRALATNIPVALVTTTDRPNIEAIAKGARGRLPLERFAAVLTRDDCALSKPAPDIYRKALDRLGIAPEDAIAIEDTAMSVNAAKAAGIYTVATPGQFTSGQDFSAADHVAASLDEVQILKLHAA